MNKNDNRRFLNVTPPDWTFLDSILPVSRETKWRLEMYVQCLLRWQGKTNLIANGSIEGIWMRHIADSLQCVAIACKDNKQINNWLDLGSGGGLPGLVAAIVLENVSTECRQCKVHMVESIAKKCAFLRQTNRECRGCGIVYNERIENMGSNVGVPDVISARALAPLSQLLAWMHPFAGKNARLILHKGREYRRELEECRGLWHFNLIEHQSRIEKDSVILEISDLKKENFLDS